MSAETRADPGAASDGHRAGLGLGHGGGRPVDDAPTGSVIEHVALDLFARIGYEATSMREIARRVGIKPASLYNHVASKEEILWRIVTWATGELSRTSRAALARDADVTDRLARFVQQHVHFHAEHAREARVINSQYGSLNADHLTAYLRWRDDYERALRDLLEEGAAEGRFALLDARLTSFAVLAMGIGVSTWFRANGPASVDALAAAHASLARRMTGDTGRPRRG